MIQTQLRRRKLNDVFAEQSRQGIESHRRQADGVQMENIPRIHDVVHRRRGSKKLTEGIQCELEYFNNRIIFMSMCKRKRKHRNMCSEFY